MFRTISDVCVWCSNMWFNRMKKERKKKYKTNEQKIKTVQNWKSCIALQQFGAAGCWLSCWVTLRIIYLSNGANNRCLFSHRAGFKLSSSVFIALWLFSGNWPNKKTKNKISPKKMTNKLNSYYSWRNKYSRICRQ